MIKAVERKPVPYVLEDDRGNPPVEQTVFWITPKRSHQANQTIQRYGGASRDARGGYRDFNVGKLDAADSDEFLAIVEKVERFQLAPDSPYYSQFDNGIVDLTTDKAIMSNVASTLSSAHLTELFDSAGDSTKLMAGQWLGLGKK